MPEYTEVKLKFLTSKLQRVKDAYVGLFPIPNDEETGKPLYTEAENIKQYHINLIKRHVHTWECRQAGNSVQLDNDIVT